MTNKIKELIKSGRNVFVTGSAGTGKSYELKGLMTSFPDMKVTATTGAAAVKIFGTTIHSFTGIGIGDLTVDELMADFNWFKGMRIKECTLLAIDEISMLDGEKFQLINDLFKRLRNNSKPFGGVQLLLFGDFLQLPPVCTDGEYFFAFQSQAWKDADIEPVVLKKIYRQKDENFLRLLNDVRFGKITDEDVCLLQSLSVNKPSEKAMKLFALNRLADMVNDKQLDELPGDEEQFVAYDSGASHGIHQIMKNSNCPKLLNLKVKARVILLKNLDTSMGLVNGAMGTVTYIGSNYVTVQFDNGVNEDIYRHTVNSIKENKIEIAKRDQIPLRRAWAISIHKSQGMTLGEVSVNMSGIFEFGQAYVVLSRVQSFEGLTLLNFNSDHIKAHVDAVEFYRGLER